MNLTRGQAEKLRTELQDDLRNLNAETFAMRRMFDVLPHVFTTSHDWSDWKIRLAKRLNVDPCSIFLIGTACTGVSLNPTKDYKTFDAESDVDTAIVSNYHFEVGWRALREIGAARYGMTSIEKAALEEHRQNLLYWGTIATDKLLRYLPFGRDWTLALADFAKLPPASDREVKVRLYRDSYSLVSYHLYNLRNLQRQLLTP
jgi:hypothetical protein